MHQNSLRIMAGLLEKYAPKSGLCVDVGSYDVNGCYRPMVEQRGLKYVGLDIAAGPNVDIVIEPYGIGKTTSREIVPHSADLVISGQCLEHVARPWEWIKDVASILDPGVPLIVIAPASWPHHRYPVDCWRIFPDGMRALLEFAGLDVLEVGHHDSGMKGTKNVYVDCWGVARRK